LLERDPNRQEALQRCYRLTSDDHERRSLRASLMALESDTVALVQYLVDEAKVIDDEGQLGAALKAWQGVLSVDTDHLLANQRVEELLKLTEDRRGLAGFLSARSRYLDASRVFASLPGGFVEQVNCLERALALSPGSIEVFKALETIYRDSESWQKLTDLLKSRLPFVHEQGSTDALQIEISKLEAQSLGEPMQAFREVLEAFESVRSPALITRLVELAVPLGEAKSVYEVGGLFS
jgi:hypothetical protein